MIYLIGGSGGPNFGDELILRAWLDQYRGAGLAGRLWVDHKIRANGPRYHPLPGVRFLARLKLLAQAKGEGSFMAFVRRGIEYVRTDPDRFLRGRLDPDDAASPAWREVRLIHLYGGGYISGNWPNSGFLLGLVSELARVLGVKVAATGLGLSPLPTLAGPQDVALLRSCLDAFTVFECRDLESHAELAGLLGFHPGIITGSDDAFLMAPRPGPAGMPKTLHVSMYAQLLDEPTAAALGAAIAGIAGEFQRLAFWACTVEDGRAYEALRARVPGLVRLEVEDLLPWPPLAPADFMITARFHPHLLAARMGMNGRYLARSPYYHSKHRAVLRWGSPFLPFAAHDRIRPEQCNPTALMAENEAPLVAQKLALARHLVGLAAG